MDLSSSNSPSWYFLLATILPICATLLALICRYYSSTKRKNNNQKHLKGGAFGFSVNRAKDNRKSSISSEDKMNKDGEIADEDRRPLVDHDDDVQPISISDIQIPKLEDVEPNATDTDVSLIDVDKLDISEIPGKLKSSKFVQATKQLEQIMTDEQKEEESEIRRQQLESIFKLMREQQEKFGSQTNDDLQEQMKLYAL